MPIESIVDHDRKTVVSTASGHIRLDDVREYFGKIWTDKAYQGYSEIIDWTGADRIELSVAELHSVAGAGHAFHAGSAQTKLAIVIDPAGKSQANLYRTMRENRGKGPTIRVFSELKEAREWMGLPAESIEEQL